jgi:phosphoribosylformylglycinamidine cyclo-ligase
MRHPGTFTYRMTGLPPTPPVLRYIVEQSGQGMEEAYGSLNMGAGFALFIPPEQADRALEIAGQRGIRGYVCGEVETGSKQVIIEPLDVVFEGKSLELRA